jgi:DNA recombination protein RmuC
MLLIVDVLLLFVGIAIGVALGWFAARSRASSEIARLDATLQATREGEARLEQSLRTLTYEATEQSQAAVAEAVAPLHEVLARYEQRVSQLERDRVGAYE